MVILGSSIERLGWVLFVLILAQIPFFHVSLNTHYLQEVARANNFKMSSSINEQTVRVPESLSVFQVNPTDPDVKADKSILISRMP